MDATTNPKKGWRGRLSQAINSIYDATAGVFSAVSGAINPGLSWVAGCDLEAMKGLASGEYNKKAAVGMAMLFSVTIAAMAAGNAAGFFLTESMTIPFGLLWAAMIFSIDRAIIVFIDTKEAYAIASGRNGLSPLSKGLAVSGRLLIVFCMSYLTSTAAEMLIYHKEIDGYIAHKREVSTQKIHSDADSARTVVAAERLEQANEVSEKRTAHQQYVASLDARIDTLRKGMQHRQDDLQLEIQGRVGSGIKGAGPAAAAIERNLKADSVRLAEMEEQRDATIAASVTKAELDAAEQFAALRNEVLDKKVEEIGKKEQARLDEVKRIIGDGFEDRYKALKAKWKESRFLMTMVLLLLMMIESLPIIMKLWSGSGLYERSLSLQYVKNITDRINIQEREQLTSINDHLKEKGRLLGTARKVQSRASDAEKRLLKTRLYGEEQVLKTRVESIGNRAKLAMDGLKNLKKHFNDRQEDDPNIRNAQDDILAAFLRQFENIVSPAENEG